MLIGYEIAKNPGISVKDLKINVDNSLIESKFVPIGSEPNDLQLLDELLGETMMSVMGKGINRESRRKSGVRKTN